MLTNLPNDFGTYAVERRWVPKGLARSRDAAAARPGTALDKVQKIVIGDTGRRGLTAPDAARDLGQAYGHFLVDDKHIIECVPAITSSVGIVEQACFVRSWHGQELNAQESAIAVNLCFGGGIKPKPTYERCVALVAFICRRFDLDPCKDVSAAYELDNSRSDPVASLRDAGTGFPELLNDAWDRTRVAASQPEHCARTEAGAAGVQGNAHQQQLLEESNAHVRARAPANNSHPGA